MKARTINRRSTNPNPAPNHIEFLKSGLILGRNAKIIRLNGNKRTNRIPTRNPNVLNVGLRLINDVIS